ncbi:caspase domain-containing protein [Mortierella sp. GBAus27b]|nr:Ca(2+)-dependent cysteine protease [Mortierella sp. GBA43]KAI8352266.1 caspase domain-containing protein [Mortierella sp. GBAus27b]
MSALSFSPEDLDIDPAILADVSRIVQELLQTQELEQQLQCDDEPEHPMTSREVYNRPESAHIQHLDVNVPLLLVKEGKSSQQGDGLTGCEIKDQHLLLPSSSTSPKSSLASIGSPLDITPSPMEVESTALPPVSPSSQDEKSKPLGSHPGTMTIAVENQDNGSMSEQISPPSEQKAPTGTSPTVKEPSSNSDKAEHKGSEQMSVDTTDLLNASPAQAVSATKEAMEGTKPAIQPTSDAIVPRPISQPTRPKRAPRKKALLIGINYFGDPNQLMGCINDTRDVFGFLSGYFGFRYQDTVMLTDDQIYEDKRPTGANIRYWMRWLVKDAEPQDSLFFHYAGHGGRIKDFSYNGKSEHLGDETDGYDEIMYPCDYLRSGIISDDEMYDLMVKELPAGVQLTALVDACHSGTMLDLPYVYNGKDRVTALESFTRTKVGAMAAMSASDNIQIDLPGSYNGTVHSQTTTTTTTTVTLTGPNGEMTHFTNGTVMTTSGTVNPAPAIHTKEGSPLTNQSQIKRSVEDEDDEDTVTDVTECSAPELLPITDSADQGVTEGLETPISAELSPLPTPSPMLIVPDGAASPGRRQRTKSVTNIPIMEDLEINPGSVETENEYRGMTDESLEGSTTPPAEVPQIVTVEEVSSDVPQIIIEETEPAVPQIVIVEEESVSQNSSTAVVPQIEIEEEEDDEGMEEAKRMAMFRATKGNVIMFSGCRDDQASADIRASAKDAAIISSHAATNWSQPADTSKVDEDIPNAFGYSMPAPYTSPQARGAVSYAWIQCLSQKRDQTYEELLLSMRHFMKQRDLEQIPQLGSGMPMDMGTVFKL